jgi:GNAT superfamily N-acetyltransferase
MAVKLRPGRPEDAEACGRICYEAFKTISEAHNFPPDFPSPEVAAELLAWVLGHKGFRSVVAEDGGKVVGSNFLDVRNVIAGVGPITVDPKAQNKSVGRKLMEAVLGYAEEDGFVGVRLVQAAFHGRSLSLYAKLGFDVREPLACMQGPALKAKVGGRKVRAATAEDQQACNALCVRVHGHDRAGELADSIGRGAAAVVERDGAISGYTTGIAFFGHTVAMEKDDLAALIGAANAFGGPGFLLPMRNTELLRWCLAKGLRVVQPLTLMSRGLYNEPNGAFLPSILY